MLRNPLISARCALQIHQPVYSCALHVCACVWNPQCSPQLPPPPAPQWALAAVTVQLWDAIATSPPLGDYHAEPHLTRHLHQYPWRK